MTLYMYLYINSSSILPSHYIRYWYSDHLHSIPVLMIFVSYGIKKIYIAGSGSLTRSMHKIYADCLMTIVCISIST